MAQRRERGQTGARGDRMAGSSTDPEPEDFATAEATAGLLPEENGSPAEARVRYEVAQAHKLLRSLSDTAERIRDWRRAVPWRSRR